MVGTRGHDAAREYLLGRMAAAGLAPYREGFFEHSYESGGYRFTNLLGVLPSPHPKRKPLLIGAHYDSVLEAPCADDNAAAIAIALGAAEALGGGDLTRDILFAFFDAEEPPFTLSDEMGSIRFFHDRMDERGVHAVVVMDLVGHDVAIPVGSFPGGGLMLSLPRIKDLVFVTGAESHPALVDILRDRRVRRLRVMATLNQYIGDMSDYAVFRRHGIPYLFLSCGRWPHYHQPTDTPDRLSYRKMARIQEWLISLAQGMSAAEMGPCPDVGDFTQSLEIELLHESLGPLLPLLRRAAGVQRLETRGDLNALAAGLLAAGL